MTELLAFYAKEDPALIRYCIEHGNDHDPYLDLGDPDYDSDAEHQAWLDEATVQDLIVAVYVRMRSPTPEEIARSYPRATPHPRRRRR